MRSGEGEIAKAKIADIIALYDRKKSSDNSIIAHARKIDRNRKMA